MSQNTDLPKVNQIIHLATEVFGDKLPKGTPMIVRRVDSDDEEGMPVLADAYPMLPIEGPLGIDAVTSYTGVPLAPGEYTTEEPK